MDTGIIPGGYILLARKILRRFWQRPPFHAKLWLYILLKASHNDVEMRGIIVRRGQLLTNLQKLSKAVGYFAGTRPEKPSIPQVSKALKSFAQDEMIATEKKHRHLLITIINYAHYQNPDSYSNEPRKQEMTARDILLAKERKVISDQHKEQLLIEMIEHYWSLYSMHLEESAQRHKQKMQKLVKLGDLPADAIHTLEEIVALRKERLI
jgi:hypothetical protein